jgi:hypothetical protein
MRLVSSKNGNAIAVCVMAIVLGGIGAPIAASASVAQDQDAQQAEQKTPPPAKEAAQPTPQAIPPPGPRPRVPIPALRNIQFEITIIDQIGTDTPVKKTLNVVAVDAFFGSVRSKANVPVPRNPSDPKDVYYQELPLNVDIRPEVTENKTRIRARLTLNYETLYPSKISGVPPVRSVVFVDQHVMLDNGKPLLVSQSADATTDRKVSVELKATILP